MAESAENVRILVENVRKSNKIGRKVIENYTKVWIIKEKDVNLHRKLNKHNEKS